MRQGHSARVVSKVGWGATRKVGAIVLAFLWGVTLAGGCVAQTALPALVLPDPAPAPPMTVFLPVPDQRVEQALASLDDLAEDIRRRSDIPGLAIAVVHRGQTVYAKGFGTRQVGADQPVDADTVFLLASVSKPIGASVVARQVDAGVTGWDMPVQQSLPWFDLGDPWISRHVTIGDLYAHRSGLPDHAGDDLEDIGYDRRQVLERLHLLPQRAFRNHYAYTNFGLTAAAEAVAAAADSDWASLSQSVLYDPLGMTRTSSRHADYLARDNRARPHMAGAQGYIPTDQRQPDAQSPAGGVSSSAADMARWMAMVLRADGALTDAITPQKVTGKPMAVAARPGIYGYGFNVGTRATGRVAISHSGGFALGASTNVSLIPDLDLGIVVLTNAPPIGAAEAIAASFLDRAEIGTDSRDWLAAYQPFMAQLSAPFLHLAAEGPPEDPAPAGPATRYVGRYENAYFGAATVAQTDDGLILRLGPAGLEWPMQHWDGDSFAVRPLSENEPPGSVSLVRFRDDGATLWIEHLDHYGLGSFRATE